MHSEPVLCFRTTSSPVHDSKIQIEITGSRSKSLYQEKFVLMNMTQARISIPKTSFVFIHLFVGPAHFPDKPYHNHEHERAERLAFASAFLMCGQAAF